MSVFRFLVVSLVFLFSVNSYAQNLSLDWVKTYGSPHDEVADAVAIDKDQNSIVAGTISDTISFGPSIFVDPNSGDIDGYVLKKDPQGNILWFKQFVGGEFRIHDIKIDHNEDVYIRGTYGGTVDFTPDGATPNTLTSMVYSRPFILKMDTDGEFIWVRGFESIYLVDIMWAGENIELDSEGNVYLAGLYNGEYDVDPTDGEYLLNSNGRDNIFIVKLDTDGNFVWAKQLENLPTNTYQNYLTLGFKVDGNDDLVISGTFSETIDVDPSSNVEYISTVHPADRDMYIMKWNSDGEFLWVKTLDISFTISNGRSVKVDYDNNIYLQGQFYYTTDFDPGPGLHEVTPANTIWFGDVFILKLDEDGEFQWVNTYNHSFCHETQMIFDECGYVYYSADFREIASFGSGTETIYTPADTIDHQYILKLDSDGDFVWVESFGGKNTEEIDYMAIDSLSNLYLVGYYKKDSCDFDPGIGTAYASDFRFQDIFIAKYNQCSSCLVDKQSTCNDFEWIDGVIYTESNNSAVYSLTSTDGCDSTILLDLTINYDIESTDIQTGCESYTWINGVTYTEDNNTATYMLQTEEGCDSLVHLNLSLGVPFVTIDEHEACGNFEWIDGQTYTQDEYFATYMYTSVGGCDSMIRLNLTMVSVETDIEETDSLLTSLNTSATATYQWLDCNDSFAPVVGETSPSISQNIPGEFALQITQGNCVDTSDCYRTNTYVDTNGGGGGIGLEDYNALDDIVFQFDSYTGQGSISSPQSAMHYLVIYNMLGKQIYRQQVNNQSNIEFTLPEHTGIYIVEVQALTDRKQFKVLKQ